MENQVNTSRQMLIDSTMEFLKELSVNNDPMYDVMKTNLKRRGLETETEMQAMVQTVFKREIPSETEVTNEMVATH